MLNATYHDDTPSKDYDGAYKFTSNLIIQYRAEKNVKYYVVSFFRDDIEYTTLINKENIKTSDEDAIINAAYAKVTKQLNMVKTFKAKNEEIKKDVEKSALLPVMDDTEDKEKVAVAIEDHANKIDINSLNIKDMLDDITSYKEKTEKVRELYRDNIAVGVDNWGDVIKKFPVKTTDNTVTKTTMTTDEIQQANKLLTQLTNIKKTVKGKQEDIDLLIKYLKWADENGKTLVASTIRTSLSSDYYKSCLSLEQLALVNNSQKVSYVGSGTDNVFSEEAFRDMLIGLTKMKKSKLVDISTDQLAALCIKDIVETINKRWSKGNTTIAELLLDKEVKILAGKDGLIDFIRNKIDLLPSGSAARRAYVYSLDTFMDLVSATSPTRVVTMAPDFNTDERKLEVKKLVEKEKTNDFLYDEEYGDQKSSNEKFMMMDNSLKEMK